MGKDMVLWVTVKVKDNPGDEDLGIGVEKSDNRIIISFYFMLDYDAAYTELGDGPFEGLRDLFEGIRKEILARNFSALQTLCKRRMRFDGSP